MQNSNVKQAQFTPEQFRTIAAINPNLRIEQVRGIDMTPDGTRITLATTVSGERIADKRALGTYEHGKDDHALDAFVVAEGVQLLSGTPGIDKNPACASIIAGIKSLMAREGKDTLVCSQPQGKVAYYLYANPNAQSVDLTAKDIGFAQVSYLSKPRGFVARETRNNRLWFLPFAQAQRGETNRTAWTTSNLLAATTAIQTLPPRIQDTRAVLCQTEQGGQQVAELLNLSGISQAQIASVVSEVGVGWVAFRCFASREVAIVEVGDNTRGLEHGTYQVPTGKLPEMFGKAGAKLVETQAAI